MCLLISKSNILSKSYYSALIPTHIRRGEHLWLSAWS